MSLQTAKRFAELREELDLVDNELAQKYKNFRTGIRADIEQNFAEYMEAQGFTVQRSAGRVSASYRGLVVVLQHGMDPLLGSFDNFEILVNGKAHDVLVVAKFDGQKNLPQKPGTPSVLDMEQRIEAMKSTRDNIVLNNFSFIYSCPGKKQEAANLPELLDIVLN